MRGVAGGFGEPLPPSSPRVGFSPPSPHLQKKEKVPLTLGGPQGQDFSAPFFGGARGAGWGDSPRPLCLPPGRVPLPLSCPSTAQRSPAQPSTAQRTFPRETGGLGGLGGGRVKSPSLFVCWLRKIEMHCLIISDYSWGSSDASVVF